MRSGSVFLFVPCDRLRYHLNPIFRMCGEGEEEIFLSAGKSTSSKQTVQTVAAVAVRSRLKLLGCGSRDHTMLLVSIRLFTRVFVVGPSLHRCICTLRILKHVSLCAKCTSGKVLYPNSKWLKVQPAVPKVNVNNNPTEF